MNVQLSFIVLAVFSTSSFAKESPPNIKIFSSIPVEYGKENMVFCNITGFYPADIFIKLLKNGNEIPGAEQTELGINSNGMFHQSKKARFTPEKGDIFVCHVKHMQNEKTVIWEPDV